MYAVVKHAALDLLRRRRRAPVVPLSADVALVTEPTDVPLTSEWREAQRRLQQLTPSERSAVLALAQHEINRDGAQALGISDQAYKSRRYRALRRLQEMNRAA
jgi:DNA-directed RNA polymerase specialized sigma24 family protein